MAFRMNTGLRSRALTGAARGRAAGVGTGFAQLTLLAQQSRQARKPVVLVASGDRCVANRMPQWIRWVTRARLASLLVNHQARLEAGTKDEQKTARILGELSAFWAADNTDPQGARVLRRDALVMARRELAAHNLNEVRTAVRRFWEKMRSYNDHHEEVANRHIPYLQYGVSVAERCERFFELRAAGIPPEFFDDNSRAVWIQAMTEFDVRNIHNLPNNDLTLAPDLATIINGLDDSHFIALLDFLTWQEYDYNYTTYLCSLLVAVTTLCKQGNVTEKWVERHTELFRSHFGNEGIGAMFTTPVIMEYAKYYPVTDISAQDMYIYLCVIYNQLADASAQVVTWVIEQAAASNVTSLTCLATALGMGRRFDLSVFKDPALGIPEEEFTAYAEAALYAINEPFGSLVTPPVPSERYADLAYIGYKLATYMDPNSSFVGYTNSLASHIHRSVKALDDFAKKLAARITSVPELDDMVVQIIAAKTQFEVHKRDGMVYFNIVGNREIPAGLQLEGRLTGQEVRAPAVQDPNVHAAVMDEIREDYSSRKADERKARAATRADWPKEYKTFSNQSGRISIGALEDWLAHNESQFSKHWHIVLAAVRETAQQRKLTPPDWAHNLILGRYREIDGPLKAAIIAMGVGVAEWNRKYHPIENIQIRAPGEQEFYFQELLVAVHPRFQINDFYKRTSRSMDLAYRHLNQPGLNDVVFDNHYNQLGYNEWVNGQDVDSAVMNDYYHVRGFFRNDDEANVYLAAHPNAGGNNNVPPPHGPGGGGAGGLPENVLPAPLIPLPVNANAPAAPIVVPAGQAGAGQQPNVQPVVVQGAPQGDQAVLPANADELAAEADNHDVVLVDDLGGGQNVVINNNNLAIHGQWEVGAMLEGEEQAQGEVQPQGVPPEGGLNQQQQQDQQAPNVEQNAAGPDGEPEVEQPAVPPQQQQQDGGAAEEDGGIPNNNPDHLQ